ncbi:MAG: MATE family efflux transporter [Xanthomonadales bacterium]|nr:MATE family efflux transporter [Xanthomonadales bacterium]
MANNKKHDLTAGPVSAHLRRQGTPFALGLVAIFSFDAADLFFVSRLGNNPLAAVSFTLPLIWLVYGIGIGFEAGAASCISRAVGRGDQAQARRLTTDTITLAVLCAIVLTAVGLHSIDLVFSLLGATTELLPLIHDYMGTWYWVAPVDMALWTALASIRARGNTLLESKVITSAALLNLALDPVLIFGLLGAPAMGVRGAALATVLATSAVLVFTFAYLHLKLKVFANPLAPLKTLLESWRHMLHIGVPAMITNAIIPVSSAIVVAMIASFGVEAVAGFGVAMRIEPMFLIPFYALSAVTSPFFGQNFGAGRYDRLLEARRAITRFCLGFGLVLALLLILLATPLTGLFSDSAPIQDVAVHYLWIVTFSYGAYGLVMSMNAAFNGIGKPLPGVIISSCRVIVVFLPLALLGKSLFGLTGLFLATLLSNLLLGAVAWFWLGRQVTLSGQAGDTSQGSVSR